MAQMLTNLPEMGDLGSIPGSGRSLGRGHGNRLQILTWIIPWTEGAWPATVMGSQRVRYK